MIYQYKISADGYERIVWKAKRADLKTLQVFRNLELEDNPEVSNLVVREFYKGEKTRVVILLNHGKIPTSRLTSLESELSSLRSEIERIR